MNRFLGFLLLFLLIAPGALGAEAITGRASVIDGDTIEILGTRIRLFGIDAPENGQQCTVDGKPKLCGHQAAFKLADKIGTSSVTCDPRDRDRFNRVVAICHSGREDLGGWMVAQGWALAYRQYADDYVTQEAKASAARLGLWQGEFIVPWEWRSGKRLAGGEKQWPPHSPAQAPKGPQPRSSTQTQSPPPCFIKGNISSTGERIYHVPGGAFYDQTRMDAGKGERWFCTEAEARTAGWRPSKR